MQYLGMDGDKEQFLATHSRKLMLCYLVVLAVTLLLAVIALGIAVNANYSCSDCPSAETVKNLNKEVKYLMERLESQSAGSVDAQSQTTTKPEEAVSTPSLPDVIKDLVTKSLREYSAGKNITEDALLSSNSSGSVYTRWGRKSCPSVSVLLYEGFVGGQHFRETGGASNYICLPLTPEYSNITEGDQHSINDIYGAEYKNTEEHPQLQQVFPYQDNANVPCAVCYAPYRMTNVMIPAIRSCPNSWTKEYEGYLMSGKKDNPHSYMYECVDKDPEYVDGKFDNDKGALFFMNEVQCESTGHCPPYVVGAELTCVVCSR